MTPQQLTRNVVLLIQAWQQTKGYLDVDMRDVLGLTSRGYTDMVAGKRIVTTEEMCLIAARIGVEPWELFRPVDSLDRESRRYRLLDIVSDALRMVDKLGALADA